MNEHVPATVEDVRIWRRVTSGAFGLATHGRAIKADRRDYAVMLNRVQRSIIRAARARVALWSDRHDAGVFAALRTISTYPVTVAWRHRTNATVSFYPEETRESGIED